MSIPLSETWEFDSPGDIYRALQPDDIHPSNSKAMVGCCGTIKDGSKVTDDYVFAATMGDAKEFDRECQIYRKMLYAERALATNFGNAAWGAF